MTCREKLKIEHPNKIDSSCNGGCAGCPHMYGYLPMRDKCIDIDCYKCWDREIPEEPKEETKLIYAHTDISGENNQSIADKPIIKDSGERTEFSSGACRVMHEGKGDMASVPWEAILRLSVHYENGAKKYERWNFRKGIPVSSFIDSACRHLAKYQCGCDDEDHLAAAAFNVLGAMLMENTKPEMVDLPLRQGKNTFEYFKGD